MSYFDKNIGPVKFFSFPDENPKNATERIVEFMNLDFGDFCFEISLPELELKTVNTYLNFPTVYARGHMEVALLTFLVERNSPPDYFYPLLKSTKQTLLSNPNMYKSFHINNEKWSNDPEVPVYYQTMKSLMIDTYNKLEQRISVISQQIELMETNYKGFAIKLDENIRQLATNIAAKNNFILKNFSFKEENQFYSVNLKIKGQGFLTAPLEKITKKQVVTGIEKYFLSNGIQKPHFEIILEK
jgi:hypothetical protein